MEDSRRIFLLRETRRFIKSASQLAGIRRIALIGSLVTNKESPKDTDLLVTIDESADIESLATLGRKLKGHCQSHNSGADIFLCDTEGTYLGRTCSYVECHPRVACRGTQCHTGSKICNDYGEVRLGENLIETPPLVLWPAVQRQVDVPIGVEATLLQ